LFEHDRVRKPLQSFPDHAQNCAVSLHLSMNFESALD